MKRTTSSPEPVSVPPASLFVRTTPETKARLKREGRARNMNLTEFVLHCTAVVLDGAAPQPRRRHGLAGDGVGAARDDLKALTLEVKTAVRLLRTHLSQRPGNTSLEAEKAVREAATLASRAFTRLVRAL